MGKLAQLSAFQLARRQWTRINEWREKRRSQADGEFSDRLKSLASWLLAIVWKAAISLAALVSFVVDLSAQFLGVVLELVDGLLGWVMLLLCGPIELLLSTPYLGRGLALVWRLILTIFWGLTHLPELPLVLLGVTPERRLRLWIMPPDDQGAGRESWLQAVAITAKILKREANVRLVPVGPFQLNYGLSSAKNSFKEYEWSRPAPDALKPGELAVGCNLQALIEDLGVLGGRLDRLSLYCHPRGSFRRLIGWGAPLMAVGVKSVAEGELAGCSLGPLSDYLTVRHDRPVCLAHEIGHACNLPHNSDPNNLMNPTCGGVHLNRWQVLLLRLSRHVTYL